MRDREKFYNQPKEKVVRKKTNYINNKSLYGAMIHYKNELDESVINDKKKPQVPKYIGESILLICNNLAKKPNFSGYTYKQDMISDGIMDCIQAVDNFNPDKSNNPFAYFTQIAWNAFLRRIQKEKKQTYIKHKNYENIYMFEMIEDEYAIGVPKQDEFTAELVRSYEKNLTKTKKSSRIVGLEKFTKEETNEE